MTVGLLRVAKRSALSPGYTQVLSMDQEPEIGMSLGIWNLAPGQGATAGSSEAETAVLALSGTGPATSIVDRALAYLGQALPTIRSAPSLGWGLLGLRAWGRRPEAAGSWLAEAAAQALRHPDPTFRLAHLLLAAGGDALGLLGASVVKETGHDS